MPQFKFTEEEVQFLIDLIAATKEAASSALLESISSKLQLRMKRLQKRKAGAKRNNQFLSGLAK